MAEQNKDDEYQFSELDNNNVFDEEVGSGEVKSSMPSGENVKKFALIGFGVLVLAFLGFQQFKSSKSTTPKISKAPETSSSAKPTKEINIVQSRPEPKPMPAVAAKPDPFASMNNTASSMVSRSTVDPKLSQKLTDLQSSSRQASTNIRGLRSSVSKLDGSLNELNTKLGQMNANIALLAQELQSQQQVIASLKKKVKKPQKSKKVYRKPKIFHIQAIIPGRAWLKTPEGKETVTVVEGTMIRGYGRVKIIDPHQGNVVFSSGKVVKFSASDT